MGVTPIVSARGLAWSRPARPRQPLGAPVLRDVDLDVHAGELVSVEGPSGCGKSVLGTLLLALRPPDFGEVAWRGQALRGLRRGEVRAWRPRFQLLSQQGSALLPPYLTVRQSLHETARWVAGEGANSSRQVAAVADRLALGPLLDRYPRFLSGGERRRAGLARVLLARPDFAFLDEPDAGLDPLSQVEVLEPAVAAARAAGIALVLVTHRQGLAARWADRRLRLDGGRLVAA